MSTLLTPIRPPTSQRGPGRIVERTTTTTREIFLDDPAPAQTGTMPGQSSQPTPAASGTDEHIRGLDRALMRLGLWLIELGRRHSLRPTRNGASDSAARADEIARRVAAAKSHDMRHFIGLPY